MARITLAALALLLLLAGGVTNPFSLLFLLHVVLMALLLPPLVAAGATALVVACYVALTHRYLPLEMATGGALPAGLLAFGWWLSFVLTSGFIAWSNGPCKGVNPTCVVPLTNDINVTATVDRNQMGLGDRLDGS